MATIVDELFIRLGLDSIGFKQGLNDAVNSVKEFEQLFRWSSRADK